jgi:Mg-chelatase subunit ChlD
MSADQAVPLARALVAARKWADEHGHAQPDDRMLSIIWRAGVAAGRAQAAADLAETFKRIADSTRQSLVSTPPEYATEQHTHRVRARAFERAAEIAKGSP